jgi:hypothetical protein
LPQQPSDTQLEAQPIISKYIDGALHTLLAGLDQGQEPGRACRGQSEMIAAIKKPVDAYARHVVCSA